jgi:hypothetical protein
MDETASGIQPQEMERCGLERMGGQSKFKRFLVARGTLRRGPAAKWRLFDTGNFRVGETYHSPDE